MEDLYVLAAETDGSDDPDCGIVFEQYIDAGKASLDSIKRFRERVGSRYGKTRIAKLVFIDE